MAEFDIYRLSEEMLNDVNAYNQSGEDGIYCLVASDREYTTDEIITRFQASNIEQASFSGLKTVSEWGNAPYGPSQVRASSKPLSKTGKYSSYTLMEKGIHLGRLRYPLRHSFATVKSAFANKKFSTYNVLTKRIQNKYGIKVVEAYKYNKLFTFERGNKFVGLIKKAIFAVRGKLSKDMSERKKLDYAGTIYLNNTLSLSNGMKYEISQQEKLTKIYDTILEVSINKYAKQHKDLKLTADEKFVARLVAGVLVSRATDFGNIEDNKNVETALTLQLSNVLATLDLTPDRLKVASKVGLENAVEMIKTLGFSLDYIISAMQNGGHTYAQKPTSIIEAIAPLVKVAEKSEEEKLNIIQKPTSTDKNIEELIKQLEELQKQDEEKSKITTKPDLVGVKSKVYLSRKSAYRYIDGVIEGCVSKVTDSIVKKRYAEGTTAKKIALLDRQYNFLDHIISFYTKNKDKDNTTQIERELGCDNVADNNVAHSYANAFIEMREYIVNQIFGENEKIEKPDGKQIATLINDFVAEKYNSKLSTFVVEKLRKNMKDVFKQIDTNTYEQTSFIQEN